MPTRSSWRCLLATIDDKPVGGGTMFVGDGAAWFGIAGTLPAFRGRGVQRSVLAARIDAASTLGLDMQTSETGQPLEPDEAAFSSYRNQVCAGFTHLYARPNYKRATPE